MLRHFKDQPEPPREVFRTRSVRKNECGPRNLRGPGPRPRSSFREAIGRFVPRAASAPKCTAGPTEARSLRRRLAPVKHRIAPKGEIGGGSVPQAAWERQDRVRGAVSTGSTPRESPYFSDRRSIAVLSLEMSKDRRGSAAAARGSSRPLSIDHAHARARRRETIGNERCSINSATSCAATLARPRERT